MERDSGNDNNGLYVLASFPIGTAVNINKLTESTVYEKIVNEQFNSITPENIFKPSFLQPYENVFVWEEADALAGYCESHKKRLHGHTLVWHSQLPGWMPEFKGDTAQWTEMFRNHIQTVIKHFKGKVKSWDVVNEAFNDDGTLRHTIWQENLGDSYLEMAFRYAEEADPDALLFYNDHSLESNLIKLKKVVTYLNNLKKQGVKINGIGMQCHISIYDPPASQISESFRYISDNNYLLHISELDIAINPSENDNDPAPDLFAEQAQILSELFSSYSQVKTKLQYGITFWGFADCDSWIPPYYKRLDFPAIYDNDYQPKPSYYKLKECLNSNQYIMMTEKLKYPIGQFMKPEVITPDDLKSYINIIEEFPEKIFIETNNLSDEKLDTRYRPEGWTIRQVVNHCADSHMNAVIRFKHALSADWPVIMPYPEAIWAEMADSRNMPVDAALAIIKGVHERWTVFLRSLSDDDWNKGYIHPEKGRKVSLSEATGSYAWHCNHHLAHITELKKRKGW